MAVTENIRLWGEILANNVSTVAVPVITSGMAGVGVTGAVAAMGVVAVVSAKSSASKGSNTSRSSGDSGAGGSLAHAATPSFEDNAHQFSLPQPGYQPFSVQSGGPSDSSSPSFTTNAGDINMSAMAMPNKPPQFGEFSAYNGSPGVTGFAPSSSLPSSLTNLKGPNLPGVAGKPPAISNSSFGYSVQNVNLQAPVVPEPSVAWLGALGLMFVLARVIRLKKHIGIVQQENSAK